MIGSIVTGKDGIPLDNSGNKLSPSSYNPGPDITKLFYRCQQDYQLAYLLQHRPFDEFDGLSLLQRSKLDQETFGAFVGAQFVPQHKKWRWTGRKNTARNKLIGILAHMLAATLYPVVHAQNEENESDKVSARVMRIIVEEHLRKAGYEMKFLYMVLSALVNPAVIVNVDYVEAMQIIKQKLSDGKIKLLEAVDDILSGLLLQIQPIDQLMVGDMFVNDVQSQPFLVKLERMSYDKARKIYGSREDFEFVEAGKTRVFLAGQEHGTLFDIEWTEADKNAVQVATFYYRAEDLEVTFVGGVFMGNKEDCYNSNPFNHRRMALIGDEWVSVPIYHFAKSYFEPSDPAGRFFYGKSGAFKEYWDDATQNKMHQLLIDGTTLDVLKPIFLSGIAKIDSTVMAPGAAVAMPQGASATLYSLSPNLPAAMQALNKQEQDMSESTQDKIMSGQTTPGVTATQSLQAQNQAKLIYGVFAVLISDLVKQIGELVTDCMVQHETTADVDVSVPGSLRLKQKVLLAKTKEKGKDITNRIVFTDKLMGKKMTGEEKNKYEWKLWKEGGEDQVIYHVNPYKFARMKYSMYIDPDEISSAAFGNSRTRKLTSFQILTDPRVTPFTDQKAVADDIIEEFSVGDPDRFKSKANVNDIMKNIMGQQGGQPGAGSPPAEQRSVAPLQVNNALQ